MRPYGIVVFPEGNNLIQYPALALERGIAVKSKNDEDVRQGVSYPPAVFYETEHVRDAEMTEMLALYPNVMFCPITLTTGKKTQPNPAAADFTISERGVLPV